MSGALEILRDITGFVEATGDDKRPAKLATIDPAYSSGQPQVTFDGESGLSGRGYAYLETYSPQPSDRVLMVPVGTTWLIVGGISTGQLAGIPPGVVQAYAGAAAPSGWLLCNGAAVSRTTYARLFAAVGTTWGVGDGSTTFNVPDLRGRVPVGAGTGSGLTARTLAAAGGAESHELSEAEMPSHDHSFTVSSHDHSLEDHDHGVIEDGTLTNVGGLEYDANGYSLVMSGSNYTDWGGSGSTGSGGGESGTTGTAGSGNSFGIMPPYAVVTYIVKF